MNKDSIIKVLCTNRNYSIAIFVFLSQFIPFLLLGGALHNQTIAIENGFFKFEIDVKGINLHFIDKTTGIDYLNTTKRSSFAYATINGKDYPVSSVSQNGKFLTLQFPLGSTATISISSYSDYISMELEEVTGNATAITFMNVPLNLKGLPGESFAACVLSMNLKTYVPQLPALQAYLNAKCFRHFGMVGSEIALIAVPQNNVLQVIREVMQQSRDIPYSTAGGAWALESKEGYGSYLMNFGTLTESTVDDWIKKCKSVGFNQIDSHGGGSNFFKFGSFELNAKGWPRGWSEFKNINAKLHDSGISSILHTYGFFIQKDSKYVTPIPSPDLAFFKSFILTVPINNHDSVVNIKKLPTEYDKKSFLNSAACHTLKIGNELIEFSNVDTVSIYTFHGCKRGVNGTTATSHRLGEKVYLLKEMFGMFLPDPNSQLFLQIADNTAQVVNDNNFDGIYLDALDASPILDGQENAWYYGTKFILELANKLKPMVGMEMSTMGNIWWHYRSRWEAWDYPVRGYKKFIDLHLSEINRGLLLPLQIGWWNNQTWNPPQIEPTFSDDIEYLGCKSIGFNAGLSLAGGFESDVIKKYPAFLRLDSILKKYEDLRQSNYFNEDIKKVLRQPSKEFTLFNEKGMWRFRPIAYEKKKITSNDLTSKTWQVKNEFNSQSLKLRIESLLTQEKYDNSRNITLADSLTVSDFKNTGAAKGVSGSITSTAETSKLFKGTNFVFSAYSTGESAQDGSWICFEKNFNPTLDLSENEGLGIWIKGDGNGELLNFRLESPTAVSHGARGDHFVKIDFTGWKYFDLIEIESSNFTHYQWPDSRNLYRSFRYLVQFNKISKLQIWYNNIPKHTNVSCVIGPIKAIPTQSGIITNPAIMISRAKITFPVKMESGTYLEFYSLTDCKLYSPTGRILSEISPIGSVPTLRQGKNIINFSSDDGKNTRSQITLITEGQTL